MRTLVIGDIHGGLKGLVQLLERAGMTASDNLIFLGDYVDGWSESAQVISYLIELSKTNSCVFIKGNHDYWCEDWLASGIESEIWLEHGGLGAIESYKGYTKAEKSKHIDFFETMEPYYIDSENRLFIHAGFTSIHGVEREVDRRSFYFDRTLWEMALTADKRNKKDAASYPKRLKQYSEIYIGHTPTINYNQDQPMNALNVWNIDTGAAFTGALSAIDLRTKAVFQSDKLIDLYPNEQGRNRK